MVSEPPTPSHLTDAAGSRPGTSLRASTLQHRNTVNSPVHSASAGIPNTVRYALGAFAAAPSNRTPILHGKDF